MQKINALDVSLSGEIKASDVAILDKGEDVVAVIKDLSNNGKTVIGFEYDYATEKFGVIIK